MPSMLSNDRFSSIRTTKWSILLSGPDAAVGWASKDDGVATRLAALPTSFKKSRRRMAAPHVETGKLCYFLLNDQFPWRLLTSDRHEPSSVPSGLSRNRTTPRSVLRPSV